MILQFSIPQDFLQIDGVVCAADGADDGYPLKKFQVQQFAGHGCGSLVDLDGLTVFHWKRGFFDELVNLPVSFYEAASVGQRGFDDLQDEVFFFGRIVGISPIESNFVDAFQQNAYKDGDVGQSYTQSAPRPMPSTPDSSRFFALTVLDCRRKAPSVFLFSRSSAL